MSDAQFLEICARSKMRCEISGIAFDVTYGLETKRPWAPSLDRIDAAKGYTADNCRLVCVAANLAMNVWGERVLIRLALAISDQLKGSADLATAMTEFGNSAP